MEVVGIDADPAAPGGEGTLDEAQCRAVLDDLRARFVELEREYEETWLTPEEWTAEVALADELLSAGLREWQDGLGRLAEHCRQRLWEAVQMDLADLREAQRKLLSALSYPAVLLLTPSIGFAPSETSST